MPQVRQTASRVLSTAISITFTVVPQPAHSKSILMDSMEEKSLLTSGPTSASVFSRNGRGENLGLCRANGQSACKYNPNFCRVFLIHFAFGLSSTPTVWYDPAEIFPGSFSGEIAYVNVVSAPGSIAISASNACGGCH